MVHYTNDSERFRHFERRYWDGNGGRADHRPVWYDSDDTIRGRQTRMFISSSWFPNWPDWAAERDRALKARELKYDFFSGLYERRTDFELFPLAGEPHFEVEKDPVFEGGFAIWVNACCPSREAFEATLTEARERIRDYNQPLRAMTSLAPLPVLPVNSADFQDAPRVLVREYFG